MVCRVCAGVWAGAGGAGGAGAAEVCGDAADADLRGVSPRRRRRPRGARRTEEKWRRRRREKSAGRRGAPAAAHESETWPGRAMRRRDHSAVSDAGSHRRRRSPICASLSRMASMSPSCSRERRTSSAMVVVRSSHSSERERCSGWSDIFLELSNQKRFVEASFRQIDCFSFFVGRDGLWRRGGHGRRGALDFLQRSLTAQKLARAARGGILAPFPLPLPLP